MSPSAQKKHRGSNKPQPWWVPKVAKCLNLTNVVLRLLDLET